MPSQKKVKLGHWLSTYVRIVARGDSKDVPMTSKIGEHEAYRFVPPHGLGIPNCDIEFICSQPENPSIK